VVEVAPPTVAVTSTVPATEAGNTTVHDDDDEHVVVDAITDPN
jgi:hypothetical protein